MFEGSGIYAIVRAQSTSLEISGTTCFNNELRTVNYRLIVQNNGNDLLLTTVTNSFFVENGEISNNEYNNTSLYIQRIYEMEVE